MADSRFRAGVGRVDATPPLTAPHASWGAQVHVLPDGVEAPLWASALVVDDGTTMAAWIDLDVVIITRAESDTIRKAVGAALGIPASHVRASVTHNHAGPPPSVWNWTNQGQEALDGYFSMLPEYAAGAARAALGSLRPARVGAGSGESRVAMNRRETAPDGRMVTGCNPGGLIDPEVLVGRIDDLDGSPIAAIVGYTMHPTTLGPPNRLISPDWPGHMKRTVESLTGAKCFFAQGATGNVGPGPEGFTDDIGVVQRLGARVGCEAARVFLALDLPAVEHVHDRVQESGAPLGLWQAIPCEEPEPVVQIMARSVGLPLTEQPPLEVAETAIVDAQDRLDALRASAAPAEEVEAATFAAKRANMTLTRVREYGGRVEAPVDVQVLRIGPVVLAGVEGEPFAEIGLEIKEASPFRHTWFGGYVGGWAGYIPTPEAYPLGGYEVETSPFAPAAAGVLTGAVISLLSELAEESPVDRE